MKYLIDANIFIEGYKSFYPIDVHVSYWNKLADLINLGSFVSIDKVKSEIQDEPIRQWLDDNISSTFFESSATAIVEYQNVILWANAQSYTSNAKSEFAANTVADAFLIAKAKMENYTLVTYERSEPLKKSKVKIPDVCMAMNVRCIDINTALRELMVKL